MNKTLKLGMLALLLAVPAAYAQDVTYDWTLTGAITGSGTISINPNSFGTDNMAGGPPMGYFSGSPSEYDYSVDGLTGTVSGGGTITGLYYLHVIGVDSSSLPSSSFTPDAQVRVTTSSGAYYEFDDNVMGSGQNQIYVIANEMGTPTDGETFTLSPLVPATPVPESPLSPGWVAAGGLLVGWQSWRKLRVAQA